MFGLAKSKEFIEMQIRNKKGQNKPLYGKIKSASTLAKITKLIYVYDCIDISLIGEYSTVNCKKEFKIGNGTINKYIENGLPFKGKIFSLIKLY